MEQDITLKKEGQGLAFLKPLVAKVTPKFQKGGLLSWLKKSGITLLSILLFLGLWHMGSKALYNKEANYKIEKALTEQGQAAADAERDCIASGDSSCQPNTLPSPTQVWASLQTLIADHKVINADKAAFNEKMAATNAKLVTQGKNAIVYTGRASFVDIVLTSIKTVFAGFLLALLIAVPIGVVIGLSPSLRSAFNWFIQIFKPVSPVVWYLLVFMIVKTLYIGDSSDNAFVISFISVGLCAMWATLVNTAMGVSSVDKDYINVAKVLKLGTFQKIFKVILPSSLPLIFTGLRITLSVAWMVLIAIELLAQSQGLGLFVWEEFQNGANDSNAKIIVAMFVIGIIGFLLDRIMLSVQNMVSFNKNEGV
ncbi:ABC transporter permease [Zobellia galactanivorans]|uniref:Nitrate-specific BPD transport, permease component n=1 Tax=Zobellia galactanivorans (strain DSM 12802 / CCUG 47099 / CIP 106680 / NCIMB 13871 / Dsij) TaxID=63186 RepID=G0LAZ6_ZOBGA|nr:ABC transporter permease [Zobellia galactanivorans]CAZ95686.1 Nitrate-specific BPD transport, permease component [Zobellia galactanivorans]